MGGFKRLINRLHGIFYKAPDNTRVISVEYSGGGCLLTSNSLTLTVKTSYGIEVINLDEMTVSELVISLNAIDSMNASLVDTQYGEFLAKGIFEDKDQDISLDPYLHYPTSLLWAELRSSGWVLDELAEDVSNAEKQLYLDKASGRWLDDFNDYFDVERFEGESDADYLKRGVAEVTSLRLNNKAIEILLWETLGIEADVLDLGQYSRGIFYTNFVNSLTNDLDITIFNTVGGLGKVIQSAFGVYIYKSLDDLDSETRERIKRLINRNKASGKQVVYFTTANQMITNEITHITNDIDYRVGPLTGSWGETAL